MRVYPREEREPDLQRIAERVGIGCMDAPIRDNDGDQPLDEPVLPLGPAAYFSPLPIKRMTAALEASSDYFTGKSKMHPLSE